jgi:hypothetical protein
LTSYERPRKFLGIGGPGALSSIDRSTVPTLLGAAPSLTLDVPADRTVRGERESFSTRVRPIEKPRPAPDAGATPTVARQMDSVIAATSDNTG